MNEVLYKFLSFRLENKSGNGSFRIYYKDIDPKIKFLIWEITLRL